MGVRCLCGFWGLFCLRFERVVAEVRGDFWLVGSGREDLVAFPAAQGHCANHQCTSSLRLVDFQLEAAAAELAANRGRFSWNLNSTDVGW